MGEPHMRRSGDIMTSASQIIRDAGGEVVGRTRLQKIGYLLQLAGFVSEFRYEYRYYGPYSEELAHGIELATMFDLVEEIRYPAESGGFYSIYRTLEATGTSEENRSAFTRAAARIGAIELELAATAAFLSVEKGIEDPWEETRRRKPEKAAQGRLRRAKLAYNRLLHLPTRKELPQIV